ncbi:DUF305 domain-containing protein [Orbaceae bacterium ESL0721]|nr:DUF305 domain-containing protein [Orbaceae bacterium ESL0721]
MKKSILALCMIGCCSLSGMAFADASSTVGEGMKEMKHAASEYKSEMQKDLMSAMDTMHKKMDASMHYVNPDKAFAAGMSAHHQGAIDMAKIELKYGKDPEMRKLAQKIIDSQGPEIDQMKSWLDKQKSDDNDNKSDKSDK